MTGTPSVPEPLEQMLAALGAPAWYLQAIAHPVRTRFVSVADGLRLQATFWNEADTGKPPLLLVHGYRAHSHAWDAIAPFFLQHYRVVALDLMGMGASDRRSDYGFVPEFAGDLAPFVEALEMGPMTLVGHSFGGACAIHFAHQRPDLVSRLVLVDTMVLFPQLDQPHTGAALGRTQPYPDYASITARYRLLPDQPCPPWALAYMAHHSVHQVPGGWSWKFDTRLPAGRAEFETQAALRQLTMPTDFIAGEHSFISSAERLALVQEATDQQRRAIVIPEAHHHILLDHPLSLVSALRALLA